MMLGRVLTTIGVTWAMGLGLLAPSQPAVAGCFPNTLSIEPEGCPEVGSEFVARVVLTNASEPICCAQFFLAYNSSVFELLSVEPGESPFDMMIWSNLYTPGLIDYAVGTFGSSCTTADRVVAVMTFMVVSDEGNPFIRFRPHHPPTTLCREPPKGGIHPYTIGLGEAEAIDLSDFARFQNCYPGEDGDAGQRCVCEFDVDGDLDVDLTDYSAFEAAVTGPLPWDCTSP